MGKSDQSRWQGLREEAQRQLELREYTSASPEERLATTGIEAGELLDVERASLDWIPGVEIFPRTIFAQPSRGFFAEFARKNEGILEQIQLWPQQWATATMYAQTAKGFHIHPPYIPQGTDPEKWFQQLYTHEKENRDLRPYSKEQWDIMFFLQGIVEIFLIDERKGLPRRLMRLTIEGDNRPGKNNVGIVIPPGVAHALHSLSSQDVIMVYGTSTTFQPEAEGRIASSIEKPSIPKEWEHYLGKVAST